VHLRRHVLDSSVPIRGEEWDDFFQEGCLGLIDAVQKHEASRGIPFAEFALSRIHLAVNRALRARSGPMAIPPVNRDVENDAPADPRAGDHSPFPKVFSLSDAFNDPPARGDRRRPEAPSSPGETIGDRLRGKYDRAVADAGRQACRRATTREDRSDLVRLLAAERFMIPDEEHRRSLRRIASETRSSIARVAQTHRHLVGAIRTMLSEDPEFRDLRRCARRCPEGVEGLISRRLERRLAQAAASYCAHHWPLLGPMARGKLLERVLSAAEVSLPALLRRGFERMSSAGREKLVRAVTRCARGDDRRAASAQGPPEEHPHIESARKLQGQKRPVISPASLDPSDRSVPSDGPTPGRITSPGRDRDPRERRPAER
jgi:hypothetical protein